MSGCALWGCQQAWQQCDYEQGKILGAAVQVSYRLEIRTYARNAFNHASFGGPDSAINDTYPALIPSVVDGGRHIQLYARFSF